MVYLHTTSPGTEKRKPFFLAFLYHSGILTNHPRSRAGHKKEQKKNDTVYGTTLHASATKVAKEKREKLETLAKNETTSPVVHRHLLCSSYPRCCQFACGLFFSSHLSATQRRGGSAHALPLAGGKKGANERSHYVGPEFPFFLSLCLAYNGTHRE